MTEPSFLSVFSEIDIAMKAKDKKKNYQVADNPLNKYILNNSAISSFPNGS